MNINNQKESHVDQITVQDVDINSDDNEVPSTLISTSSPFSSMTYDEWNEIEFSNGLFTPPLSEKNLSVNDQVQQFPAESEESRPLVSNVETICTANPLVKRIPCPKCHRTFQFKRDKIDHVQTYHKDDLKFYCNYDNRCFNTKTRLTEHMGLFHLSKVQCPDCSKYFAAPRLKVHEIRMHEKVKRKFICDHCGKIYMLKHQIKEHMIARHMDADHNWRHKCEKCCKKFINAAALNRHKATTHGTAVLNCDRCDKVFNSKHYLRLHQNVHLKKGFECPLCISKPLVNSQRLRAHIVAYHPELPLPPSGTVLKNYDWSSLIKDLP